MTTPACRTEAEAHSLPVRPHPERSARLSCDVAPSRLLRALLLLALLQSLLLLWLSPLPWPLAVLGSAAVIAYSLFELRRLRHGGGQLSTRERRWFWRGEDGRQREFCLQGELVLWRWLIVINGHYLAGEKVRLVLARDGTSADDWRRLQVALRYSRAG